MSKNPKPCGCEGLCSHGRIERKTPLRSKKRPNRRNKARRKKEFERAYGGSEYVEHLHGFPCEVCGVPGWTEAAHTEGGGVGRKADADTLVPLCGNRLGIKGCHDQLDDGELEDERPRLKRRAKQLRRQYLKHDDGDTE